MHTIQSLQERLQATTVERDEARSLILELHRMTGAASTADVGQAFSDIVRSFTSTINDLQAAERKLGVPGTDIRTMWKVEAPSKFYPGTWVLLYLRDEDGQRVTATRDYEAAVQVQQEFPDSRIVRIEIRESVL
jgi:hypothetical protein